MVTPRSDIESLQRHGILYDFVDPYNFKLRKVNKGERKPLVWEALKGGMQTESCTMSHLMRLQQLLTVI